MAQRQDQTRRRQSDSDKDRHRRRRRRQGVDGARRASIRSDWASAVRMAWKQAR